MHFLKKTTTIYLTVSFNELTTEKCRFFPAIKSYCTPLSCCFIAGLQKTDGTIYLRACEVDLKHANISKTANGGTRY